MTATPSELWHQADREHPDDDQGRIGRYQELMREAGFIIDREPGDVSISGRMDVGRLRRVLIPRAEGLRPSLDCSGLQQRVTRHLEPVTVRENILRSPLIGAKDECKWGHRFTPENTYVTLAGARACRACKRRRQCERRQRIKAAA